MSEASEHRPVSARAHALLRYLRESVDPTFCTLGHWRTADGRDIVDVTMEPELPQDRAVPISNLEPVRLSFPHDDHAPPIVQALREDFPLGMVHTNLERGQDGLCLCVWEESWPDLGRTLTAQGLVERLRQWLTRSARGELHQPGQPLEPLIPPLSDTLVIPAGPPPTAWHLSHVEKRDDRWIAIADEAPGRAANTRLAVFATQTVPQLQGALAHRPHTLEGLADTLKPLGIDLVAALGDWLTAPEQLTTARRSILLVVSIPKLREQGGAVEEWETWAFLPSGTLGELGELLGRTYADGDESRLNMLRGAVGDLDSVVLFGWRVVQRLDRAAARRFAGNPATSDRRLVAIGAGAIGSNVIANTVRAGVGVWTIVDNDLTLPHNTVRQAQTNEMVGFGKAKAMSVIADGILSEEGHRHLAADALSGGEGAATLTSALAEADMVLDFSASPAVLGHIADENNARRTGSMFFGPDGADLVVLAEDADRSVRLDELEAQYLWAAVADPAMEGHLTSARTDFIRYANACQDLSRPLPPWQVQTLCGIAGGTLLALLESGAAFAGAWRLDPPSGAVLPVGLSGGAPARVEMPGWRVTISPETIASMRRLRSDASPNETGGILIGSFDADRGVVHVVAALRAPPDSRQSPTFFIRGAKELGPAVDEIGRRSAGTMGYVGEWHSHPDGAAARPSADDEGVWRHIERHIGPTGAPYVMSICGAGELWVRGGWHSRDRGEGVVSLA